MQFVGPPQDCRPLATRSVALLLRLLGMTIHISSIGTAEAAPSELATHCLILGFATEYSKSVRKFTAT